MGLRTSKSCYLLTLGAAWWWNKSGILPPLSGFLPPPLTRSHCCSHCLSQPSLAGTWYKDAPGITEQRSQKCCFFKPLNDSVLTDDNRFFWSASVCLRSGSNKSSPDLESAYHDISSRITGTNVITGKPVKGHHGEDIVKMRWKPERCVFRWLDSGCSFSAPPCLRCDKDDALRRTLDAIKDTTAGLAY